MCYMTNLATDLKLQSCRSDSASCNIFLQLKISKHDAIVKLFLCNLSVQPIRIHSPSIFARMCKTNASKALESLVIMSAIL